MAQLPDTKHLIRVIYEYQNGGTYILEGEDVKRFVSQAGSASVMAHVHGMTFKPLNWKRSKKSSS